MDFPASRAQGRPLGPHPRSSAMVVERPSSPIRCSSPVSLNKSGRKAANKGSSANSCFVICRYSDDAPTISW